MMGLDGGLIDLDVAVINEFLDIGTGRGIGQLCREEHIQPHILRGRTDFEVIIRHDTTPAS